MTRATDSQRRQAHVALSRLVEGGLSVADVAKLVPIEHRQLARFFRYRQHLSAERCFAVTALARSLVPGATGSEPMPPPR